MQTYIITPRERATLLVSVLVISICSITYELIIGTLSSYLLGNSVTQFSLTIGLFLFAMGIGSLISRQIRGNELRWFILVELLVGLFGGFSAAILYAVFATSEVYYYTVMITLILLVGVCIGLEIPLLTRIVAHRSDLSKALADILSVDYLGALLASLAFPLVLLPSLGVTETAFLTGAFNIAVAALNLHLFRKRLGRRQVRLLWGGMATAGILTLGGVVGSASLGSFLEQQLYVDRIIYREQTPYQRIIFTKQGDDLRMFLDGQLQFSSRDEYRYHELLVHPVMSVSRSRESIAVLGGGDGMAVRELLKYDDVKHIVLVDLDPAVTALAEAYPLLTDLNRNALDDPRVEVINQDAYKFIEDSSALFNVIIIDLPDPNNESLSKLYSETFYRLLRKRLTPDGAFVTQATSPYFAREAFWSIAHTIEAADFAILPLHTNIPSFGDWGFVIGTPHRTPEVSVPDSLDLRYLTPDVLTAALIFDPDIAEVPAEVNTLDNPILMRYYDRGWRQWD